MVEAFIRPPLESYQEINVLALAARTTNGQSNTILLLPEARSLIFFLSVTASAGTTPTLDIAIEQAWDLSNETTDWTSLGSYAQKTGVSKDVLLVTNPFTRKVRANYGIGGTNPSFTFKIDMIARS